MKMKSSQMFFVELFILVFYVHEHICSEVFLRLNVRHHVTSQRKPNTAKHTSQQQTIRTDHHPGHSHPMAKGQKKRSASDGGNMANKSHKWLSAEGDDDENEDAGTKGAPGDGERMTVTDVRDKSSTKGNSATTPHDCDAETNLQKDPRCGNRPPPHEKNDQESMNKVTKGGKKRSASDGGNTANKSCKRLSGEGNNDKNKDTGTHEAPGDGERLTATDGRDTSSTKDDGATTPHDCDAETNLQKDADTHSSAEGDGDKRLNVYLINSRSKPSGHSGSTPADIAFVFLFQHSTGIRQPQRSHAIPETDIALEPPARTNHGHLAVLKRL